jgi:hypothetical protein
MGFIVTSKNFILFLDSLDPVRGLAFYYIFMSCAIIILEYLGLIIAGVHFKSIYQFLGTLLLNFSFFIIVIWSNCYTSEMVKGRCNNFSKTYLNTESGATYYLWSKVANDIQAKRILIFVVTPFILAVLGLVLIKIG